MSIEIVSPKRVLLAEPHDETRLQYRSLFGHAGYDVVDTSDGRDALAKALVRVPSIVVTALELPGLDGLALCEILRQDRVTTRVPILVLAAKIKSVELDRARRLADAVLLAPSSPEAVVARAQSLIARAAVMHAQSATLRSRSSDWQARAAQLRERSHELDSRGAAQRASLRERHRRFETSHPPLAPPRLRCPVCDGTLSYLRSYVGGVNERSSEQWDDYECPACGAFQYRHRTRKLRRSESPSPQS